MRTSHKKHRPFDFKLIDLVEPNEVIYKRQPGLSNYELMKIKNEIWRKIASEMNTDVRFCVMRWNNLRYQFRKELRRETELCPKLGIMRTSTWPYLERLYFLKDLNPVKPKPIRKNEEEEYDNKDSQEQQDSWDGYGDDEWDLESEILKDHGTEQLMQQEQQQQQETNDDDTQLIKDEIPISNTEYIMIEDIIDSNSNEEIIEEEIIYENSEEEREESKPMYSNSSRSSTIAESHLNDSTTTNMQQMDILLQCMRGAEREEAEKRILTFALKCQLRALMNQSTDDLSI